jgi:hypothetical protein
MAQAFATGREENRQDKDSTPGGRRSPKAGGWALSCRRHGEIKPFGVKRLTGTSTDQPDLGSTIPIVESKGTPEKDFGEVSPSCTSPKIGGKLKVSFFEKEIMQRRANDVESNWD